MRPVVVTGAKGFIGRRVVARLAGSQPVVAVDIGELPTGPHGVSWVSCDLSKPLDRAVLPSSPAAVIHLAQAPGYRDFPGRAREMFDINVASTFDLLEYAREAGARSFVFASSGGVCGPSDGPLAEDSPFAPSNFYLRTKVASEVLAAGYAGELSVVLLRFFFPYGPGQRDKLIPDIVSRVKEGREVVLYGEDGLRFNPIYVDDVAEAVARSLSLEGLHTVNVAGDEVSTLRELAEMIGAVVGRRPVFRREAAPGPQGLVADTRAMDELLGRWPRVGLREGLERTIVG